MIVIEAECLTCPFVADCDSRDAAFASHSPSPFPLALSLTKKNSVLELSFDVAAAAALACDGASSSYTAARAWSIGSAQIAARRWPVSGSDPWSQ